MKTILNAGDFVVLRDPECGCDRCVAPEGQGVHFVTQSGECRYTLCLRCFLLLSRAVIDSQEIEA